MDKEKFLLEFIKWLRIGHNIVTVENPTVLTLVEEKVVSDERMKLFVSQFVNRPVSKIGRNSML